MRFYGGNNWRMNRKPSTMREGGKKLLSKKGTLSTVEKAKPGNSEKGSSHSCEGDLDHSLLRYREKKAGNLSSPKTDMSRVIRKRPGPIKKKGWREK